MREGRTTVTFNLFTLRRKLEIHNQRKYTWVDIARMSGLNRKTLESMAKNRHTQVRFSSLESLLTFFHDEGMPIGIQDLLVITMNHAKVGKSKSKQ